MRDVVLSVNGREYRGWKDITITRSLESLCGSFSMSVSERWNANQEPWPIREGDRCVVLLGGDPIVTGFVDTRSMSISANDHSFQVAGRDRAGDLVDCSAVLSAWEFTGVSVLDIVRMVAKPFGISVSVASNAIVPAAPPRVVINPGESVFDVIDRACRLAGLFAMSDGEGNLVLTQAGGKGLITPLVLGENILQASVQYDASACYRRYIVSGQQQGQDLLTGTAAADVRAQAQDMNVGRSARVLMVRAEGGVTIQQAQDRANWEACVRRARALELSVTVQGWEQADGSLWPVNALAMVDAPALDLAGVAMLISEVSYSLAEGAGSTTDLTLRPAEAFLPEPEIPESEDSESLEEESEPE
jgi:prophage tail gpP-like protein